MKIYYASTLLALLFITNPIHLLCMNSNDLTKITNDKIYKIKTEIEGACCTAFLSDEKIVIGGREKLSFISFHNSTETETSNHPISSASRIATNNDNSLCALSGTSELKIYATETESELINIKHNDNSTLYANVPIAFDSQNKQQLFYRYKSELLSTHNANFKNNILDSQSHSRYLICHPKKTELFECIKNDQIGHHKCYSYEPSENNNEPSLYSYSPTDVVAIEYNYDGSICAMNTRNEGFYLIKENNNSSIPFQAHRSENEKMDKAQLFYSSMTFHPNNAVLALLNHYGAIEYWNCLTSEKIAEYRLDSSIWFLWYTVAFNLLSISPNGRNIIAAMERECFILEVPFTAVFQGDTRKKALTAFLSLQKYAKQYAQENNLPDNALPQDIINLICQIYWNYDYVPIE